MNFELGWMAKILLGVVFLPISPSLFGDSYYPESIAGKVESACQALLVDVVASSAESGGYQDYRFSYHADVLESWNADWQEVQFKTRVDIGVGRRAFIVFNECAESEQLGSLRMGLSKQVYLVNRDFEKYKDEIWLEVSVGTHQLPEGWETYEIKTKFSGEYRNNFSYRTVLFKFEMVRLLLENMTGDN